MPPHSVTTLILGAGAAGLMCAAHAGPDTLVVDHAKARAKRSASRAGALQFHQPGLRAREFPGRKPAFSPNPPSAGIRSGISSTWSTAMASPGTRKRWANCSATARQGYHRDAAGRDAADAELWLETEIIEVAHAVAASA
jgi:glycine/D-amino acid oxidase-like deaminating enzyme